MKPKLIVMMPVYNGMPYLKDAIQSILAQTYKQFHFLIIDDGSTDKSLEYLKALTDARVEHRSQKNMGVCATLNEAIATCDAELIARLDQDDIALPFRLQEQVDFLVSHRDYACVLSNISRISGSKNKDFGSYEINSQEGVSDYSSRQYGCIVHSTICFRRESFLSLGGYRSYLYPVDDYDLLLRYEENYKVAVINRALVKYRIHGRAGTFKTFYDMDIKTRYAEEMAARRRFGAPEISLMEYNQILNQASLWEKLRRSNNRMGRLMFRKAGLMIGERHHMRGLYYLMGACLLAPRFALGRLKALHQGRRNSRCDLLKH
jgi:glycosyltransferase involved in cell wall biosynthesis